MARSKPAKKTRIAEEFSAKRAAKRLEHQAKSSSLATGWTIERIHAARAAQMVGSFTLAAQLAAAMKTDDALFVAYSNRLAPQKAVAVELVPANAKGPARAIAEEAEALYGREGIGLRPETVASIHGCLVDHNVAFAVLDYETREDAERVDISVRFWPIEFVRWDPLRRAFVARVEGGLEEEIVHGNGRWIVFAPCDGEPWQTGAIVPASTVWSRHALSMHDWTRGSKSHGDAKILGALPQGIALQEVDENGVEGLTAEAEALLSLLESIAAGTSSVGLKPSGAEVKFESNSSTAWQVWAELAITAEKAAARIYLGTDGVLGAQGGAPGVDVTALFGVATTIVQGDLGCISRAIKTGLIDVWAAINFGDSTLAPTRRYMLPDADEDAEREGRRARRKEFFADIADAHAAGFVVDAEYVEATAKVYGIDPPTLRSIPVVLAAADLTSVMRVNEARASAGLGPLLLPDGSLDPAGEKMMTPTASPQP